MSEPRREKKSETLEVRLSHAKKRAFMAACAREGITASDAVRRFVDVYIVKSRRASLKSILKEMTVTASNHRFKFAGIVSAMTIGAFALSTGAASANEEIFKVFDKNGDGVLTDGEIAPNDETVIAALDKDSSGDVSLDEFLTTADITIVNDNTKIGPDVETRVIVVERVDFDLSKVGEDSGRSDVSVFRTQGEIDAGASEAEVEALVLKLTEQVKDMQAPDRPKPPTPPTVE